MAADAFEEMQARRDKSPRYMSQLLAICDMYVSYLTKSPTTFTI